MDGHAVNKRPAKTVLCRAYGRPISVDENGIIRTHKAAVLRRVADILHEKPKYVKQARLLPFCRAVELTITNHNELAVKYELKPGIQAALSETRI